MVSNNNSIHKVVKTTKALRKIILEKIIPLDTLDISGIIDMNNLFTDVEKINGSISNWNTSSVKFMESMFQNSLFSKDISIQAKEPWRVRKWDANERIINNSLLIVNEDKR